MPHERASPVHEYLRDLSEVIPKEVVSICGEWTSQRQLRYAQAGQSGTGAGPFVETELWQWTGTCKAPLPLAGLVIVGREHRFCWAKSAPAAVDVSLSLSVSGWRHAPSSVSLSASFHGASLGWSPLHLTDEPPLACKLDAATVETGVPHVLTTLDGVVFSVVFLPGASLRVGRNRLWRVREELAARLSAPLADLLTRRRSGQIEVSP